MGVIVGAGLLGHVPSLVRPEEDRKTRAGARESTFPRALQEILRQCVEPAQIDSLLIFDSHWHTTDGFVVNTQERLRGVYTSHEWPSAVHDLAFDYRGDQDLGEAIVQSARRAGLRCEGAGYQGMALYDPTIQLMQSLNPGRLWRVLVCGVCQTAAPERHLEFGAAVGRAIEESARRVIILGAGGLSHQFWSYDEMGQHSTPDPRHIFNETNRAYDEMIIEFLKQGNHAAVIDIVPEFRGKCAPEGFFAHYSMLVGALGGKRCKVAARQYGSYESLLGTGQVMLWFPL